jgi:hypothetical protein
MAASVTVRGAPGQGFIQHPIQATGHKPLTPFPDGLPRPPDLSGYGRVRQSLRTCEYDPGSLGQGLGGVRPSRPLGQQGSFRGSHVAACMRA